MAKQKTTTKDPAPEAEEAPTVKVDVIRAVLKEVCDERKAAHVKKERLRRDLDARHKTLTDNLEPLNQTLEDAKAAVTGHDRYKGKMEKAEWEKELTRLKKAEKKAKKAFDDEREKAMKEISKLRKPQQDAEKKATDLDKEWKYHERLGKAAGLDMDDFWTPEDGIPDDEDAAAEDEPEAAEEAATAEE